MSYKAKINWQGFKQGEIVPEDIAKSLLSKYKKFTDQSILIEALDEVQPKPKQEVQKVEKKAFSVSKKNRKKSKSKN